MADSHDIGLIAHLMRRAGFGAPREELEMRAAKGYNATVEELLHPEESEPADQNVLLRYQPAALLPGGQPPMGNVNWMFHLVNTKRHLQEKMTLFWHHVFATGNSKVDNYDQLLEQIEMFREKGMGNYRDLLVALAKFRVRNDSDSRGVLSHVRKSGATASSRTQGNWSTNGDSLRPRTGPRPSYCGAALRDAPARPSFPVAFDDLSNP